jgi:hypothetical protein
MFGSLRTTNNLSEDGYGYIYIYIYIYIDMATHNSTGSNLCNPGYKFHSLWPQVPQPRPKVPHFKPQVPQLRPQVPEQIIAIAIQWLWQLFATELGA